MRFFNIDPLFEGYKETRQLFLKAASPEEVDSMIAKYRDLVNRNQVSGNERNIDWWGKQGWDAFSTFVNGFEFSRSKTQIKRGSGENYLVLAKNDDWTAYLPLDKAASVKLGKGSDWCTTKPNHQYFESYYYRRNIILVYAVNNSTGDMVACSMTPTDTGFDISCFDKKDNDIGPNVFEQVCGFSTRSLVAAVTKPDVHEQIQESRGKFAKMLETCDAMLDKLEVGMLGSPERRNAWKEYKPKIEALLPQVADGTMLNLYCELWTDAVDRGIIPPSEAKMPPALMNMLTKNHTGLVSMAFERMLEHGHLDDATTRAIIASNPHRISLIDNPSLELVKIAIDADQSASQKIKNPSPEVVKFILNDNPYYIKTILDRYAETGQLPDGLDLVAAFIKACHDFLSFYQDNDASDLHRFIDGMLPNKAPVGGMYSKTNEVLLLAVLKEFGKYGYRAILQYARFKRSNVPPAVADEVDKWIPEEAKGLWM